MSLVKRIMAVMIAVGLVVPSVGVVASGENKADEEVTLIVQMQDGAVFESSAALASGGAEFSQTKAANKLEKEILTKQVEVQSDIKEKVNNDIEVGYTYTTLFNGFSIEAKLSDVEKIKALPEVKDVFVSQSYVVPEFENDDASLAEDVEVLTKVLSCCEEINADYMHNLGYTGKGQIIAVIDNEFDANHEFFEDEVENPRYDLADIERLLEEKEFNVEARARRVYHSSKLPFVYDYYDKDTDTYGGSSSHGTHVAGIAAGKNGNLDGEKFSGTAPETQIALMKVSADSANSIMDAHIIAAMDDAAKLGVCAMNCSFGTTGDYKNEAFRITIENANNCGVLIVAANGNSGRGDKTIAYADEPDYDTAGAPALTTGPFAVASNGTKIKIMKYFCMTIGNGESIDCSYSESTKEFYARLLGNDYGYVYCGRGTGEEVKDLDLSGKIAVIDRDNPEVTKRMSFVDKAKTVYDKGAVGVIFVNYEDEVLTPSVQGVDILCMCITKTDGQKMIDAEEKTLQIQNGILTKKVETDDSMSQFTSWGTGVNLELKPEITAPGGNIYASVPDDEYDSKDGTSMATPHITGAMAVLTQYVNENAEKFGDADMSNKTLFMQNLMMSSAKIIYAENGIPASPRQQGSGLVDLKAATKTPVVLKGTENKAKISLKELDESGNFTIKFTAENFSDTDVVYNTTLYVFTDDAEKYEDTERAVVTNSKKLIFDSDIPKSVTVPAKDKTEIVANVTLDKDQLAENSEVFVNGFWVDGFVVLTPTDESLAELSIPYTGFYGDWKNLSVFGASYFENMDDYYNSLSANSDQCIYTQDGHSCLKIGDNLMYTYFEKLGVSLDGYDKKDYFKEEFAGYSPNGDGAMDKLCGTFIPIRVIEDFKLTVEGGEYATPLEIASESYYPKYYYSSINCDIGDISDGDYEMVLSCRPYIEGVDRQSRRLKFYVDTEAPKIKKMSIRTEGDKKYLDLSLTDNRYLMSVILYGENNSFFEMPIEQQFERTRILNTSEAAITFDITDLAEEDIEISIEDYAGNMLVSRLEEISVGDIDCIKTSDYILLSYDVYNYIGEDTITTVIAALYDKDGGMISADVKENVMLMNGESELSSVFENDGTAEYVKIFVWDSISGAKPLCNVGENVISVE